MLILGIESSCDETAASVLMDGNKILSSAVASQDKIHSIYGGVVPELASRSHIEAIIPVIKKALKDAQVKLNDIDGIAVTKGPGLVGSLLIGLSAAKSISFFTNKPIVGVNHLHAHLLAASLEDNVPEYPCVGLVVSGGHTSLYLLQNQLDIRLLGKTRDDAAGEAFDKVAKLLNLGYPGGIQIEKISKGIDPAGINFPRAFLEKNSLDFSFSGLKTSVVNLCKNHKGNINDGLKRKIASSFQEAVVDVLVKKMFAALESTNTKKGLICGGVAANERLRQRMTEAFSKKGYEIFIPRKSLCTDNAAMVAKAGYLLLQSGVRDDLRLNASSNLEIKHTL